MTILLSFTLNARKPLQLLTSVLQLGNEQLFLG